jgi:hypothetical protein
VAASNTMMALTPLLDSCSRARIFAAWSSEGYGLSESYILRRFSCRSYFVLHSASSSIFNNIFFNHKIIFSSSDLLQSQRSQTCLTTTKTSRATKVSSSLKQVTFHEQRSDMTQEVVTETTAAMTKAARVEAMETTLTQEAEITRAREVEGMETTPTQETETTRAPAVEVEVEEDMEIIPAQEVEVEDMEIIPAQEVEINRVPQAEVEDMEIIPAQEVEINRAPQVEGKARLNRRESRPLRALLRKKDGRHPSLPHDFETEVDAVWWILMKNFIVLSGCIIIE